MKFLRTQGLSVPCTFAALLALSACNGGGRATAADTAPAPAAASAEIAPAQAAPASPAVAPQAPVADPAAAPQAEVAMPQAPSAVPRSYHTDALIYAGDFAAFDGPEELEAIAKKGELTTRKVSSAELDKMSVDDLAGYGVILWPGGYAGKQSASLEATTRENIRRAVNERGVGFVGFCAGAFIAVSPAAKAGEPGPDWGFAIMDAETLPYYHLEDEGTTEAMVKLEMADGSSLDMVWWGGPILPEYPKGVIARYPDTREPAIVQTWAGKGLLVMAGPHPEAPASWRKNLGLSDSDGLEGDQKIALEMFQAALKGQPMATLN